MLRLLKLPSYAGYILENFKVSLLFSSACEDFSLYNGKVIKFCEFEFHPNWNQQLIFHQGTISLHQSVNYTHYCAALFMLSEWKHINLLKRNVWRQQEIISKVITECRAFLINLRNNFALICCVGSQNSSSISFLQSVEKTIIMI